MEVPIKFKFFEKLKLYQDYLKASSMLERTKDKYWLCEKSIMFWAYSRDHQHLGVPLNTNTFTKRARIISKIAKKIGVNNNGAIKWVKSQITNNVAVQRVLENLITLGLVTKLPGRLGGITINLKGFLLGELLFETYDNPGFWSRNFRKFKLTLLTFYATFMILLLTVFLVFVDQLLRLIEHKSFVVIGVYLGGFLGYSWWSTVATCLLVYLGLKQIWKRV